ncbi:ribonuclease III [Campylobacter vicugnae]|uniref:Ribonuclease 3 n=1 Tax=Campylobacter vicugnae TaxID=1660076 RepID=A0A1X9SZA4_9BACT|nr:MULTISPECIES: ribonuclease III [Campylobacter]ARR01561.1 ribonuclease III [Campylobacter sp. RM8964]MDL0105689.1 ribonuclease III [Campylobacter ovis]MDL0107291.1 ribonuclease III [Campylobacter ovis]
MDKLKQIQKLLKYEFKNINLLKEAITHKSIKSSINNERLEFLGDAVLDLIVGEYLYHKFNTQSEGDLSKLRASLVNEDSLAKIAKELKLGEFLYLSPAEENNGGRDKQSLISDALEALMGAIYLESGLDSVKVIFIDLLEKNFPDINLNSLTKDYKTALQEITQAQIGTAPKYELISSSGPDHKKSFEMAVLLNGKEIARATGNSKKAAEQACALKALEMLKNII